MPRVELHPHVIGRMPERGATEAEIVDAVVAGESYPVKFGRMGFRKDVQLQCGVAWTPVRSQRNRSDRSGDTGRLARAYGNQPIFLRIT